MKRRWMSIVALMLMAVMALSVTACGKKTEEQPAEEPAKEEEPVANNAPDLSEEQLDSLMWQLSDKEVELRYREYIPDEGFAKAEVFGIDRDGDNGTAYVNLFQGEYVVVDGKAYNVAGSAGEAIIKFKYTNDNPEYVETIWSADGSDHEKWLEENFPKEYLKKAEEYLAHNDDGKNVLELAVNKDVQKEMGVPVETENLLEIDEDAGTYEIIKTTESGSTEDDTYKFDTEVIKQGKLEDLKE